MQFISNDQIQKVLSWHVVLEALEVAFRHWAKDNTFFDNPERVAIQQEERSYLTMPCADVEGWFGVKQASVIPSNPQRGLPSIQAWYTLFNPEGTPVFACDATLLTRIRTAAVSALAARYLAPKETSTLLVIGTGSLAPWMARAHSYVRSYKQIIIWGRSLDKAEITAKTLRKLLDIPVHVSTNLEKSVAQADVISSATTAKAPLIYAAWLDASRSQHIDLVGAFLPDMVEVDSDTVKQTQVIVDAYDACHSEAGDLIQAAAKGWQWSQIVGDLAGVVSGNVQTEPQQSTLFKSVGLALEDLAVAKQLITLA